MSETAREILNTNEVLDTLRIILAERFETTNDIELKTNIRNDLGLDSVDLIGMVAEIEERFDMSLQLPEGVPPETIEDVVNLICKYKRL